MHTHACTHMSEIRSLLTLFVDSTVTQYSATVWQQMNSSAFNKKIRMENKNMHNMMGRKAVDSSFGPVSVIDTTSFWKCLFIFTTADSTKLEGCEGERSGTNISTCSSMVSWQHNSYRWAELYQISKGEAAATSRNNYSSTRAKLNPQDRKWNGPAKLNPNSCVTVKICSLSQQQLSL